MLYTTVPSCFVFCRNLCDDITALLQLYLWIRYSREMIISSTREILP